MRHDPLVDEWVAVAGHRQARPSTPGADCPLCPSRPGHPTEIPAAAYEVAVFDNRYPAFAGAAGTAGAALLSTQPAGGACEVVCFADDHDLSFARLGASRTALVVDVWAERTAELSTRDGIAQVLCFENRGAEIGATLTHPHGQIYAVPFVAPRTARMLERVRTHRERSGANLFDEVLAAELRDGQRVVARGDGWVAHVPHAARWPYEVRVSPLRRVPDLPALDGAARRGLADLLPRVFGAFERLWDAPAPYVAAWHQAPAGPGREEFGLHLQVFSPQRDSALLKQPAGTEAAMGVWSNDVVPEAAAEALRAALR